MRPVLPRPVLLAPLALLALLALAAAAPPAGAVLAFDPVAAAGHASDSADGQANATWQSADEAAGLPAVGPPASDAMAQCVRFVGMDGTTGYGMDGTVCADDALPDGVVAEGQPGNATGPEESTPEAGEEAPGASSGGTVVVDGEDEPRLHAALPSAEARADDASVPSAPAEPAGAGPPAPATVSGDPSPDEGRRLRGWTAAALATALLLPSALALKLASLLGLPWRSRERAESPVVAALLAIVAAEPGIHHTSLVRRLGKGNGTVEHHARRLAAAGRLVRHQAAGYTCYLPPAADPRVAAAHAALRGPTSRRLAAAAAESPGTLSQLAAALGLAVSTVHYHAGRLVAAGVLQEARQGAGRGLALTDVGRACLGPAPAAAASPPAGQAAEAWAGSQPS